MTITKISAKGWIVIPSELRRRYGLKPGDKMHVRDEHGRITLIPVLSDPIHELKGIFKGGPSLSAEVVAEHRREVEHDQRDHKKWLGRPAKSSNRD